MSTFYFDDIQLIADTITIGLESLTKIDGLSCFPNPAKEYITITSDNGSIDAIAVYDVLGNQVFLNTPKKNYTTLDLADLMSGVYIARILVGTETNNIRFIKE